LKTFDNSYSGRIGFRLDGRFFGSCGFDFFDFFGSCGLDFLIIGLEVGFWDEIGVLIFFFFERTIDNGVSVVFGVFFLFHHVYLFFGFGNG
jgi:hypothetical protein